MTLSETYLIENRIPDIVINANEFPTNTPENAEKWIYLSDVMERFLETQKGQELPKDSVISESGDSRLKSAAIACENFGKEAEKIYPAYERTAVCECKVCGIPFGDKLSLYEHNDNEHN